MDFAIQGTLIQKRKTAAFGRPQQKVHVYKIDRIARSTIDLLNILNDLQTAGVGFAASSQQIDTTCPMGRMLVTLLGSVAEFERETCVERVKIGLQRARENGVDLGRPKARFDTALAIKLSKEGLGVRKIAKQVGVSYGTVHRYLKTATQSPSAEAA